MRDFGKVFFALAVAMLFAGKASAQPAFSCTNRSGVPPLVRSQGVSEFVGDVILICTGGVPTLAGEPVPQNNIQIYLNTNINSRLLAGILSEALLIVDEPDDSQQRPCTPGPCPIAGQATSTTGSGINYATADGIPNVFQGTWAGANSISWLGVPIDPPGPSGVRTIRLTNIRANARQVLNSQFPQLVMFISVTGSNQVAINNPQQTVGYNQTGLTFAVSAGSGVETGGAPVPLRQCVDNNPAQSTNRYSAADMTQTLTLSFKENFATAFKPRVVTSNGLSTGTIQSQNIPGT